MGLVLLQEMFLGEWEIEWDGEIEEKKKQD